MPIRTWNSIATAVVSSEWMVESSASISDPVSGLEVTVRSMTFHCDEPLSDEYLAELDLPLLWLAKSEPDELQFAHYAVHERMGLHMEVLAAGAGSSERWGSGMGPREIAVLIESLGLEEFGPPEDLAEVIRLLPVPQLGSPPEDWRAVGEIVGASVPKASFLLASGLLWDDKPVLALIAGATGVVIWFTKPLATTLRDHANRELRRKLRGR